jgi:hypothetical protein
MFKLPVPDTVFFENTEVSLYHVSAEVYRNVSLSRSRDADKADLEWFAEHFSLRMRWLYANREKFRLSLKPKYKKKKQENPAP